MRLTVRQLRNLIANADDNAEIEMHTATGTVGNIKSVIYDVQTGYTEGPNLNPLDSKKNKIIVTIDYGKDN